MQLAGNAVVAEGTAHGNRERGFEIGISNRGCGSRAPILAAMKLRQGWYAHAKTVLRRASRWNSEAFSIDYPVLAFRPLLLGAHDELVLRDQSDALKIGDLTAFREVRTEPGFKKNWRVFAKRKNAQVESWNGSAN